MTRRQGGVVLVDGPAQGRYSIRRAPHFLRAVVSLSDGTIDVLDQLHDEPRVVEVVHVYEADGPTWDRERELRAGVILCPPPGASGSYRHRADVDGEQLRDTADWRRWCSAQPGADERYDPLSPPPAALRPVMPAAAGASREVP